MFDGWTISDLEFLIQLLSFRVEEWDREYRAQAQRELERRSAQPSTRVQG